MLAPGTGSFRLSLPSRPPWVMMRGYSDDSDAGLGFNRHSCSWGRTRLVGLPGGREASREAGHGRKRRLGAGGEGGSWGSCMCFTSGADRIPRGVFQHLSSSPKLHRGASGIWQSSGILGTAEEGSAGFCPLKSQPVSLASRTGWGPMKTEKIGWRR